MACVCGHSQEEHGGDPDYPGSDQCQECPEDEGACLGYEEGDDE